MAHEIEFDWDDENAAHLAVHKVVPGEFEELILNEPLDLRYEMVNGEARYRSVGITNGGRVLTVAWTIRDGRVRAITAFRATVADRKAFLRGHK